MPKLSGYLQVASLLNHLVENNVPTEEDRLNCWCYHSKIAALLCFQKLNPQRNLNVRTQAERSQRRGLQSCPFNSAWKMAHGGAGQAIR